MVETAPHLTDHALPRLTVRQWVVSVPKRLCYFMQRDGAVLNMVLRLFLRVIAQAIQSHRPGAQTVNRAALHNGAEAFIHRFASSLNRHVHFHVCVVDGLFEVVAGDHWTSRKRALTNGRYRVLDLRRHRMGGCNASESDFTHRNPR